MANYVLAYAGGSMAETEEAVAAAMAVWGAWFEGLGDAVVEMGNPFGPGATVAPDGSITDGGTSRLTGYSILQADDLNAATALTKGCPVLAGGGTIQVYEAIPM